MKVLSVNASVTGGGAERIALELHERYRARGHQSQFAVGNRNADVPETVLLPRDAGRSPWARMLLAAAWRLEAPSAGSGPDGPTAASVISRGLRVAAEPARWARVASGWEDFDFPWTAGLLDSVPARPDLLHLHNLHGGYFDIRALPRLTTQVPTILTLHDTWALTGHCAQPFQCERWRIGCGECPDLGRYVPIRRDRSAENRAVKRAALLGSRIGLAAPSRWLLSMAEESGLLGEGREGRVIPNGVDTAVFAPGDRAAARARVGLPLNRRIVLVAAKGVRDNPYKGFDTLLAALELLPADLAADTVVVVVGDEEPARAAAGRVEVRGVPFVGDAALLAEYYRAADSVAHPSRAEAFGLVAAEAMACGTPVIVSDAGGLAEVVEDGVSGLVFPSGDAGGLAARLTMLLNDPALRSRLSSAGSLRVRERFTIDGQADSYLAWYAELIEQHAEKRGTGRSW